MANGFVPALVKFGETLSDGSVEASQKLRVLNTLNDVKLTLSELSESRLGRIVSRLKNEPGDLGKTARSLVTKWKTLLQDYLNRESALSSEKPERVGTSDEIQSRETEKAKDDSRYSPPPHTSLPTLCNKKEKSCTPKQLEPDVSRVQNSSPVKRSVESLRPLTMGASPSDATTSASTSSSLSTIVTNPANKDLVVAAQDTKKKKRKRKLNDEDTDSIDATSGLSFMESLCAGSTSHPVRKKKAKLSKPPSGLNEPAIPCLPSHSPLQPSAAFTAAVLSSLNEEVDRPDIVNHSPSTTRSGPNLLEDDEDDGDLKFRSKKILWVPKPSRNLVARIGCNQDSSPDSFASPPSLIDLCLNVVERNLSRVDHVGQVPYELFGRTLRHATATQLAHIEQCNPQFVGYTDDLWQRHVQRDFQHAKEHAPRANETWGAFYARLASDEEKRLNRIIHRSARKIKEEMEARRTTRTTEVIPPRQIQKRARQLGFSTNHLPTASSSKSTGNYRPLGEPTNVSRPNNSHPIANRSTSSSVGPKNGVVVSSGANSAAAKSNGGLLNKLRKQFQSGRLR